VWTYFAGPILALLPARWRAARLSAFEINWSRATLLSGIFESVLALAALVVWYSIFVTRLAPIIDPYVGGNLVEGYVGLFSLLGHPLTWVIIYFGMEGAIRTVAALTTEETLGTLPLVLLDWAWQLQKRGGGFGRLRLVADEITRGGENWDLKIASCRPNKHWKYPLTIRFEDVIFQIIGEEQAESKNRTARPHVYLLRRLPANEIIRALEPYDPRDVLKEREASGFFATMFRELRGKWAKAE
jgi:hypothetical protein